MNLRIAHRSCKALKDKLRMQCCPGHQCGGYLPAIGVLFQELHHELQQESANRKSQVLNRNNFINLLRYAITALCSAEHSRKPEDNIGKNRRST